jgi:hypothetical protein
MPVLYFRCKLGAKGAWKFFHLCIVPVAQSAVEVIETIRGTFASAFFISRKGGAIRFKEIAQKFRVTSQDWALFFQP